MMRHPLGILLAGTLLVSACQIQVLTPPGSGKKDDVAVATKKEPKPSAKPSGSPGPVASGSPTIAASPSAPAEPTVALKGSVSIDAAYLIGQAGGNLIGQAGGNVIATGGGNVISVGGGNVIATGGGNVISVGGGNLIGQAGGNLIGQAGGNYSVFQAASVPLGTVLPVQRMAVVPVLLGSDRQAGPAVFTNDKGEFELNIPESVKGTLRLYAAVPGKDENDPILKDARLWYNLLVSSTPTAPIVIDEDTVKVSQMLRDTFREKFIYFMTLTQGDTSFDENAIVFDDKTPVIQQEAIKLVIVRLREMVKKHDIRPEEVREAARLMADQLIARLGDLNTIKLSKQTSTTWAGPETPAMPEMVSFMKDIRTRATEKMAAGQILVNYPTTLVPKLDAKNAQTTLDNEARKARGEKTYSLLPPIDHLDYQIKRPSDLTEFMVREFLTEGSLEFERLDFLLEDLVRDGEPKAETTVAYKLKIDAFGKAMGFYFGLELLKFANEENGGRLDAFGAEFRKNHPR